MSIIYIITGQTGTGKTKHALEFAQKKNGELVNCDSRQIYKHLDIITGKDLDLTDKTFHLQNKLNQFEIGYYPTLHEPTTKIWLYDIVDPKVPFSTYDYSVCALETIKYILAQNKTPIIVGGTYFYLKQLIYGGITHAVKPDWELRKVLEHKSVEELQELIKDASIEIFQTLNNSEKHNPQRLIRWIEIAKAGPSDPTHLKQNTLTNVFPQLQIKMIGITPPSKKILKQKIGERVEKRLTNGAIEEVKKLLTMGYARTDPGLKTIGYSQVIKYLDKTISLDEMKNEWITKELQYAKRQITFMKKDRNIEWIAI